MMLGGKERRKINGAASYKKGIFFESQSYSFLKEKGYDICGTRVRTPYGEIDIIAKTERIIVFVEVKMRSSIEEALNSISPKQKERISLSAWHYVHENYGCADFSMRFDVLVFSNKKELLHCENAWQYYL